MVVRCVQSGAGCCRAGGRARVVESARWQLEKGLGTAVAERAYRGQE